MVVPVYSIDVLAFSIHAQFMFILEFNFAKTDTGTS